MYTEKVKSKIKDKVVAKITQASEKMSGNINEHLDFGPLSAYMIIGKYHRLGIENDKLCIVVSSIGIANEKSRRKGFFKAYISILADIAKKYNYRLVFESVHNEDLKGWLIKHQYTEVENINNFYKDFI